MIETIITGMRPNETNKTYMNVFHFVEGFQSNCSNHNLFLWSPHRKRSGLYRDILVRLFAFKFEMISKILLHQILWNLNTILWCTKYRLILNFAVSELLPLIYWKYCFFYGFQMINRIPLLKSFENLTQYHDPQNTG